MLYYGRQRATVVEGRRGSALMGSLRISLITSAAAPLVLTPFVRNHIINILLLLLVVVVVIVALL